MRRTSPQTHVTICQGRSEGTLSGLRFSALLWSPGAGCPWRHMEVQRCPS